ncbi:uncharacterized protein LOC124898599 [Capsicum annuum]|uniref:uncharacterized protein LOC107872025 n=1 Tax=Capsicum annuum TaxID=4072 RepID=UPI001FB19196|nr:uncharacterized protein LOC107872025 [Capsicum annuum]XP_047262159.1 uncharacterized protein LOC124895775 [Capsicum annuum]XP_047262174.1 uncharacterized protein LOC124895796 [Capsicum annuum]XP_047268191.1 uncharacterized protein LOC124898599 [Capsicum annuum]
MQGCHLFLRRPWQSDRLSKHDRRTNQYSFAFNGQKFTHHLLSSSQVNEGYQKLRELKEKGKKQGEKEDQIEECDEEEEKGRLKEKSPLVMLSRNKDLFKEHDEKTPMLLLAHDFYANHSTSSIPHSISPVLKDYGDVFPKEFPQGLPPLQAIEHQINFMSGSQLPNKPAYQSNPKDTKEL